MRSKRLFAWIFILLLVGLSSCSRPKWKDDPALRKKYQTRGGDITQLNPFSRLSIPDFVIDFQSLQNRKQTVEGMSGIKAFADTYLDMHLGNAEKNKYYSPALTGLYMWLLFAFILVLLVRVIQLIRYRRNPRAKEVRNE